MIYRYTKNLVNLGFFLTGNFVHHVCHKITCLCQTTSQAIRSEDGEPDTKRQKQSLHDAGACGIHDLTKLRQLFVQNRDGKSVLFVDQGTKG